MIQKTLYAWPRTPVAIRLRMIAALVSCLVALVAADHCQAEVRQPANLDLLKREIRSYVDSGQYEQEISAVALDAERWLEQRVKLGGHRLTVVFDLDETLFSSLPLLRRQDFGYTAESWDAWIASAKAPPISPIRDLYRTARRLGISVVVLTGRFERDRASTEKNLKQIGCGEYAALICRPNASLGTTGAFKLAERRRLAAEGNVIIANIGDQDSDLAGGVAERAFKLPDPFYLIE